MLSEIRLGRWMAQKLKQRRDARHCAPLGTHRISDTGRYLFTDSLEPRARRSSSMQWAVASALAVLGVASSAAGQVVNFIDISDAVSNRCYSAEESVPNVANPNQLQIGVHNGSCAASSGSIAPRQVMDTISFHLEAPPGWMISTVHFSQEGSTSSSGTGQAFAGVTWVIDDIPESIPMTTSGWSATVDLSGENLDLVPISITTFLGAAKAGARGSARATATNPAVTVTLEPTTVVVVPEVASSLSAGIALLAVLSTGARRGMGVISRLFGSNSRIGPTRS